MKRKHDSTKEDVIDRAKQVIIIRKDLKMRRGKEIAQGSHASMAFLTRQLMREGSLTYSGLPHRVKEWLHEGFRKVTLQVGSEEELLEIYERALHRGIEAHLITDSGLTEFAGFPTNTAVALGPDYDRVIDQVTGDLELY